MSFATITTRQNGQKVTYSWFEALKTAGVAIENFLGGGFLVETSFTVANNQSSAANVTGLVFDKNSYKSAYIMATVRRKTNSNEAVSVGRLIAIYKDASSTWELIDELGGDDDGVTFSITAAGQVQYTSDNMAGTGYTGTMRFKALTFGT